MSTRLEDRLVVELARLGVTCDDCGRSRMLGPRELRLAAWKGAQTYADLCRKIRCSECPPQPARARNLTLVPVWREPKAIVTESGNEDDLSRRSVV